MSKMPGPKHLLPSRRHASFSVVPTGVNGIEVASDQKFRRARLLGFGVAWKSARGPQPPNP